MVRIKERLVFILTVITIVVSCSQNKRAEAAVQSDQSIDGTFAYHVNWNGNPSELILRTTAKTKVKYKIIFGEDVADLEGATLTVRRMGEVIIQAIAEETMYYKGTSALLSITCDNNLFLNKVGEETVEYTGKSIEYAYKPSNSIKDCKLSYSNIGGSEYNWSDTAPIDIGTYAVKLDVTDITDTKFTRYSSLTVIKKKLKFKGLGIKTKVYDGTTAAEFKGTLVGAGADIRITWPAVEFKTADAGKNKSVSVNGSLKFTGKTSCYELPKPSLKNLKGEIKAVPVTIIADSKSSTEGQVPEGLTYSVSGIDYSQGIKFTKEPTLKCKVTKNSRAGSYAIIPNGAKAKNYVFSYVNGTYTVNAGYQEWTPEPTPVPTPVSTPIPTQKPTPEPEIVEPAETPEPTEPPVFQRIAAGGSIRFNGITTKPVYPENTNTIEINQVITSSGDIKSTNSGYEFKIGKSGWTSNLNIISQLKEEVPNFQLVSGENGECFGINELKLKIRSVENPELRGDLIIHKFIIDKEIPCICLDGEDAFMNNKIDGEDSGVNVVNQPVRISVDATYGLTGESILQYKLISTGADASDSGWRKVTNNEIIVAQDFNGQAMIKAEDKLGNNRIVFSKPISVDVDPPSISGIEYNQEYIDSVSYSIEDLHGVAKVELDGEPVKESGVVDRSGTHTMHVVDSVGNEQSVTFKIRSKNWLLSLIDSIRLSLR